MFAKPFILFILVLSVTCAPKTCGTNEVLKGCGSACEPSCYISEPEVCTKQCLMNRCQCANGFVRDIKIGNCVKLEECSKDD